MPANSPTIRLSLDLPNELYYRLRAAAFAGEQTHRAYLIEALLAKLAKDERPARNLPQPYAGK